jgi:WD repeat-containing protein 23
MKVMKLIQGSPGGWTITDAYLSPDNERLVSLIIRPLYLPANVGSFIPPL